MKILKKITNPYILALMLFALLFSCKRWDNFTTYYNTYYNMERVKKEAEEEFDYQEEKTKNNPRVIIPDSALYSNNDQNTGIPPFMSEFVITKKQRQQVEKQVDSIIIKGSKVLSMHPKSEYVEKSLYNIATAYFYKNEWLPCQVKCAEVVDKFPNGDMAADALLMYSKTLLIQKKYDQAEVMLSRTVDMAWQKKKYDILSQAFRLQAESQLFQNNIKEAVKPYKQAIVQSDDNSLKARWQLDLALLYYKIAKFDRAINELNRVFQYGPDYISYFEAKLYTANSLSYLGRFDEAKVILDDLEDDGKFEEWKASTFSGKLLLLRLKGDEKELFEAEKTADSAFTNNPAIIGHYYSRAKDLYDSNDYNRALNYYAKSKVVRTPVFYFANHMSQVLTQWKLKNAQIFTPMDSLKKGLSISDSSRAEFAKHLYELGRIHEELGHPDSVDYYYDYACKVASMDENESAKYLYVNALNLENKDLQKSDSLMEIVVHRFTLTDYGKEAMKKMGYTEAFVIDTVMEIYHSGTDLMRNNEIQYALMQFNKILTEYPHSKVEARTLYAIGWIYENQLLNYDSALVYYKRLVDEYPSTSYAEDVKLTVEYLTVRQTGQPVPDYLKPREMEQYVPQQDLIKLLEPPKNLPPIKKKDDFEFKDIFTNPSKLLDKSKEMINEQVDKVKNFDLKSQLDSMKNQISLDSLTPKFNIPEGGELPTEPPPTVQPPDTTIHR